jgi:L-fucose isomerase-like protein
MANILINYIAYPSASEDIFKRGEKILHEKLPDLSFETSKSNPDILFILTGGSEYEAKNVLDGSTFVLILAMNENNSYAAATEIKAYCNQNNIGSILLNIDTEENLSRLIEYYLRSQQAIQKIKQYKLGLLGNISNWLIASDIQSNVLKSKFDIELLKIEWDSYKQYSEFETNNQFITHFNNSDGFDLKDSSKVYSLLEHIIEMNKLDAITVECFPMVREHAVTACLALSKLNNDSFPAGCEGDLTSITGMIIARELIGQIPWMANLVYVNKNTALLAHCTIATNLVSNYKIATHFETNLGTAVQGNFEANEITIFRFDKNLEKAFITTGKVTNKPNRNDACRTQIEVELPYDSIELLKEQPLGNHHLVLPGKFKDILEFFCKMKQIKVI